mmetsp:Transcript_201/g.298  ORF Transcript_201/g.298 Transcript_201/m.298 type:complete len:266 (-) Transcript_201:33-830(-)
MAGCVPHAGDDVASLLTKIVAGGNSKDDPTVSASLAIDCLCGLLAKVESEGGPAWSLPKYFERALPVVLEATSAQLQAQDALRKDLLAQHDELSERVRAKQMQLDALSEVARIRQWQPYKHEGEAEQALQDAYAELEELECTKASLKKQQEGLSMAVEKATAAAVEAWEAERLELEAEIQKREEQVKEWSERVPALHGQLQALEKESTELNSEIAAAEVMVQQLPETEALLKAKEEEWNGLLAQVRTLRIELTQKKKKKKPWKPR